MTAWLQKVRPKTRDVAATAAEARVRCRSRSGRWRTGATAADSRAVAAFTAAAGDDIGMDAASTRASSV